MMQMIVAGGMDALTDGLRAADESNPRGYYEWEPAKSLKQRPEAISDAEGKVVKIISALIPLLPSSHQYRVIFMRRPLEEVIASQNKMLQRLGREVPLTPKAKVIAAFEKHLKELQAWSSKQDNLTVLDVSHKVIMERPQEECARISAFVGGRLDIGSMVAQVDRSLHRERGGLT
jgi:hypothetical protein